MLRAALAGLQKGPAAVRLPQFPDRLKGGRIERWKNYWLGVATDYREALLEMGQGARQRPIKASVIVSLIGKYGISSVAIHIYFRQCCGSGSGIRNRFFPDPGCQTHICVSLMKNCWVKSTT
jgi:hypothetical protein